MGKNMDALTIGPSDLKFQALAPEGDEPVDDSLPEEEIGYVNMTLYVMTQIEAPLGTKLKVT